MPTIENLPKQFILYQFPNEKQICFEELSPSSKEDFTFQIQSFNREKNLFFKTERKIRFTQEDFNTSFLDNINQSVKDIAVKVFSKEEYIEKCTQFIEDTQNGNFEKLVLSRVIKTTNQSHLGEKFLKLTQKYPSALVYLLKLENEIWLGATPELLVEIQKDKLKTMALAGTRNWSGDQPWHQKEIHEHQVVVDYICKALAVLNPTIEKTKTITLKNLQHLMTPIHAKWDSQYQVLDMIDQLHPTPAVCGIPKQSAFEYILKNEGYDRSFYSGIIGWKNHDFTRYFVNLRCARISGNNMDVFVGGGITAKSIATCEWEETNLKSQALLNA